jgi:hypothetical protein
MLTADRSCVASRKLFPTARLQFEFLQKLMLIKGLLLEARGRNESVVDKNESVNSQYSTLEL